MRFPAHAASEFCGKAFDMGLFSSIRSFYAISAPSQVRVDPDSPEGRRYYRRLSLRTFVAATLGYGMYYVCRTSLNVMKEPILDSGVLDAAQLGVVGSALLFAYAAGKFVNGFVCDYCNIRRFMATGLIVSLAVNLLMGLFGFAAASMALPTALSAVVFAVMWGINGWVQSMGSPPAIISLSRWFPLSRRGTFYGFFSTSHNLGEFFSFLFVGLIVSSAGWQWGFVGSAVAGVLGTALILLWMQDTPESVGLPPIERISHERESGAAAVKELQREVVRMPAVWILAAASAFMYMSRYAVNGWGMLYLQKVKGMPDETALMVISVSALFGVVGTVFSGWLSDTLFHGNRSRPALFFGVLNSLSIALFLYGGDAVWVNVVAMVLFGTAIGVLICFLGGLMAVDIVPRKATGAALGIMGMVSYVAAGCQDILSGWLIESNRSVTAGGEEVYDFSHAAAFWLGASVISFLLPLLNRRRHNYTEDEKD